ncbi:ribonuclease III [Chloroflexota bacterium]
MADLAVLQKALGVSFDDLSLLEQSLVHSSYINENPGVAPASNERLEFLGDAVLGFIVAEKLYRDFPDLTEGEMTRLRSVLVCRETLARVAGAIKLGDYLYLGKGEETSGGRLKDANLSGALEAILGAVFFDQGLSVTRDVILKLLGKELRKVTSQGGTVDCKSQLQELVQSRYQLTPAYRLIKEAGPDHDKRFTVEVKAGKTILGRGSGKNKKTAETAAARAALKQHSADFTH